MDAALAMIRDHWSAIAVAGGPLAAAVALRLALPGNKALGMLTYGAGAWLGIKVMIGPMMDLVKGNVTQLIQITSR